MLHEVLDAEVISTGDHGITVEVGPVRIIISKSNLGMGYYYDANANPPCYTNEIQDHVSIRQGSSVRLRLESVSFQKKQITGTGTLEGDFLGVMSE